MRKGFLQGLIFALVILGGALIVLIARILIVTPTEEGSGTVAIGGPFQLVDHRGLNVSDADFRGQFMLVYFGYTYCPDVCPTELQSMTVALDELDEKVDQVQPLFITIDPARDTPEILAEYVTNFHPKLIGLTGSPSAVAAVAAAYRVYFSKSPSANGNDNDYLMDHSSFIYLMDRQGHYLMHFSAGSTPEKIAAGIRQFLS